MVWLEDTTVLAYGAWAALVVGLIGTVAGLIGLRLTYNAAVKAKTAAEAAADAAKRSAQAVESKMAIGSISYSCAQVGHVKELLHDRKYSLARALFYPLKRDLLQVGSYLAAQPELARPAKFFEANIDAVSENLDAIADKGLENSREHVGGGGELIKKLHNDLSAINKFLSTVERGEKVKIEGAD